MHLDASSERIQWIAADASLAAIYFGILIFAVILLIRKFKEELKATSIVQIYSFLIASCTAGFLHWLMKAVAFKELERVHRIFESYAFVLLFCTFTSLLLFWARMSARVSGTFNQALQRERILLISVWTCNITALLVITIFNIVFQVAPPPNGAESERFGEAFQLGLLIIRVPLSLILVTGFVYLFFKLRKLLLVTAKNISGSYKALVKVTVISLVCTLCFLTSAILGLIFARLLRTDISFLILGPLLVVLTTHVPALALLIVLSLNKRPAMEHSKSRSLASEMYSNEAEDAQRNALGNS